MPCLHACQALASAHKHKRVNGGIWLGLRELGEACRRSVECRFLNTNQRVLATRLHVGERLVSLVISRQTDVLRCAESLIAK